MVACRHAMPCRRRGERARRRPPSPPPPVSRPSVLSCNGGGSPDGAPWAPPHGCPALDTVRAGMDVLCAARRGGVGGGGHGGGGGGACLGLTAHERADVRRPSLLSATCARAPPPPPSCAVAAVLTVLNCVFLDCACTGGEEPTLFVGKLAEACHFLRIGIAAMSLTVDRAAQGG